jgi:AAA+ ATPase superfamily predicted ATPase
MRPLIGRKKETERFLKLARSPHSDFIAVYGRRRVGKTFLIRSVFKNKFTFQITGMANTTNKQQLINFHIALKDYDKNSDYPIPENWFFAFQYLMKLLKRSRLKKKIIFIDELPWFDT